MASLGKVSSPTQSHLERALSRRTLSLVGDLEAGYPKNVFEVPHPPWMQLYWKGDEELGRIKNKAKVREFYENQNQTLAKYAEVDELLSGELVHHVLHSFENPTETTQLLSTASSKREKDKERIVSLAINLNFALNVVLLSGKGIAVLLSGSISIWACYATDDSAGFFEHSHRHLDFYVCNISQTSPIGDEILFKFHVRSVIARSKKEGEQRMGGKYRKFPIFSLFMIAMFLQVGVEGIKRLLSGATKEFILDNTTIIIMAVTIITKTVAWQLSARVRSTGVQALAQHINVAEICETIINVPSKAVGSVLHLPWLDPLGGIVLSLYIIIEWTETLMLNFRQLSGRSADPDEYRRMLYLITRFTTPKVSYLEVYHTGTQLICEADVQFSKETSFEEVHNVSEAIQVALECLEDVNRAYIHADFTVLNPPSHTSRIG
ncbi:cation diffusion facilitator [Ceratobasidium theobromae]|uniref:Cation diffusion facilitator n=1 Tax=Ceratobasidium theobromae TaxID=1582974 RepID=A0A5N5QFY8_9AGAM|nr:cation diffusion facilitator [Ceratobasidium theobromae]